MNQHPPFWTEENTKTMIRLNAEGQPASVIAVAIGAKSRNAVIGKLHRLGIVTPRQPLGGDAGKKAAKAKRANRRARVRVAPTPLMGREIVSADTISPDQLKVNGAVHLLHIRDGQCRAIIDDHMMMCAKPTVQSSSWCAEHRARYFAR